MVVDDIALAYLECVLPRKALVAVVAGKRLDSQMYPLVSLQVVVPVEALWTLVAFERPIVCRWLLVRWMTEEMRHSRCVAAVETRHHPGMNAYQRELAVRVLNVGENRCLVCRVRWRWSLIWVR
jgi:hypothetical protein